MMRKITPLALLAVATVTACAGAARTSQVYRADTQKVLETRNAQIKSCYDEQLKKDAAAGGTVTVKFVVEKKTGAFTKATIDPSTTNAQEPVRLCVLDAITGLKLDPPDVNEGRATFSYELKPTAPAAPSASAAPPPSM